MLTMRGLIRKFFTAPRPEPMPEPPPAPQELLTPRDVERLAGVHPDLVRVVRRARRAGEPFTVIEGLRSVERQRQLFAAGASRTLQSRHLTGHAVDLGPVPLVWSDAAAFARLAAAMRAAADAEGVPVRWGGDFRGFYDGPHFELPRDRYPAE
jgi:peptidoglycan LD-endopeptidase CwlK